MTVSLIAEKTFRSRETHPCQTCDQAAAEPGQQYRRATCVYDGQVYDWVQCDPCRTASSMVSDFFGDPEDGVNADDFREWATETVTVGAPGEELEAAQQYLERLHPDRHHGRRPRPPSTCRTPDTGRLLGRLPTRTVGAP